MNGVAQVYTPQLERIYKTLKSGDANADVITVYLNWQFAKQAMARRFERCVENWRFYAGLDNDIGLGQWPQKAVAYMLAQHRQILTYNFCKPIVDRIAGGILEMPFEPNFYPVNSEITSLTEAIKTAMYSDKELMDWNVAYKELVDGGLIFEGVLKPFISTEYDKLGNIGYEACLPGSVYPDPMWKTTRSKDCECAWHEQWFMPDNLLDRWGDKCPQLESEIAAIRQTGRQYGEHQGVTWGTGDNDRWGSAVRVVSEYRMVNKKYKQEYVVSDSGKVFIPRQLPDAAAKIHFLNSTLGEDGWEPDRVFEDEERERVCIVKRIAPSLSWHTILEEGEPEWQTGALPFNWWSASRINGEPHSIIDGIKDSNIQINYLESLITHKWQTEGGGGAQFVDRSMFANDEEFERYRANRNDPTETFEMLEGVLREGRLPALPVIKSEFPREAYEHLNHIIGTILPHTSKVVPTTRGMQEDSGQSGYLYNLMTKQADLALYSIHFGLQQFWNELYEGYLKQAARQYSNEQVERVFSRFGGKETIKLNERISLPDGRIALRNDASQLQYIRHKVIISEVQQSPTKKLQDLKLIGEFVRALPPTKAATINFLVNKQAQLIDGFSEVDKEILEELGGAELQTVLAQLDQAAAAAQLAAMQARAQIAAMEAQQMQQMQMQGGQVPGGPIQPPGLPSPQQPGQLQLPPPQGGPQANPQGGALQPINPGPQAQGRTL